MIVLVQSFFKIVRATDIEGVVGAEEDVDVVHGGYSGIAEYLSSASFGINLGYCF